MSESCCSTSKADKQPVIKTCPECGAQGKPVQRITVGSLLVSAARKRMPLEDTFLFCPKPDCDVVYFLNGTNAFHLEDLAVRVGQKAVEEPKPVCYCFGYTEQMVIEDVVRNQGKTNIPAEITAQVKAGNCFCEVTNPQGTCCLSNVSQAVKKGISLFQTKVEEQEGKK